MDKIERIKQRKKELNLTFEELAKLSGIPLRTLENIFHGVTKHPRIDTMQAIERALGLDVPAHTDASMSEEDKELLGLIQQMTEEEIIELTNYVDFIISKRK